MEDVDQIAKRDRFGPKENETLYVVLLKYEPEKSRIESLKQYNS